MFRMQSGSMLSKLLSGNRNSIRTLHKLRTAKESSIANDISLSDALPFDKIPQPKGLPLIGTILDYTSFRGFDITRVNDLWLKRHHECGDIYKESIGLKYWVFCRTKEDTERLFRLEGRMPFRSDLAVLREVKSMMGYPDTVGNLKGEEWYRLRQPINRILVKKQTVWKYCNQQRQVCEDMVSHMKRRRDENLEIPGYADALQAWAFEMAGIFVFNTKLGLLQETVNEDVATAVEGSSKMMQYIGAGFMGGPWKYFMKLGLKKHLLASKSIMLSIINEQMMSENIKGSLLEEVMSIETFSEAEKESLLMDILLGAVETTASTIAMCLYCLATNSDVQDKLRNEIMALTPEQSSSGRAVDSMSYMNAFFKETHRLYPFIHALPREFEHDVVLSGYRIPAGVTIINTINTTSNMDPGYFENPSECMPERWIDKSLSKFVTSSGFGVGARACPGRFFAKQEIFLLLIEILSNFKVEYHHEPATSIMRATGCLSREPMFKFVSICR